MEERLELQYVDWNGSSVSPENRSNPTTLLPSYGWNWLLDSTAWELSGRVPCRELRGLLLFPAATCSISHCVEVTAAIIARAKVALKITDFYNFSFLFLAFLIALFLRFAAESYRSTSTPRLISSSLRFRISFINIHPHVTTAFTYTTHHFNTYIQQLFTRYVFSFIFKWRDELIQ